MARSVSRSAEDADSEAEIAELSLEAVLRAYEQPLNEEQAWALCFQCCGELSERRPDTELDPRLEISEPTAVLLHRDGRVTATLRISDDVTADSVPGPDKKLVQSLGVVIYRALDWGLDDSEERELSPQLEQLIELMVAPQDGGNSKHSAKDEGYSGQEEDEEEEEGAAHGVHTLQQVMNLCARRLPDPSLAPEHYQAVCRALFLETLELQTFLSRIRDAKEMLKKIRTEGPQEDPSAELVALQHTDWARLWVQLMKELRQGVKLKKVEEQPFNPLPIEFSLTPFEMLMQDIRLRKYKLRKVQMDGDIPTCVKRNAHELILDFIRSRPPLKPVSERTLPPPPQRQEFLHVTVTPHSSRFVSAFGSLPCLAHTCQCNVKSTSCIDLSITDARKHPPSRTRVLLKAPTLEEMEEMSMFEDEDSPDTVEIRRTESFPTPMKRDRSFSERDLDELREDVMSSESDELTAVGPMRGERQRSHTMSGVAPPRLYQASFPVYGRKCPSTCAPLSPAMKQAVVQYHTRSPDDSGWSVLLCWEFTEEFCHPVETLALTVDEVINVRRILVKAEMEKYLQNKELYNQLKKGKICCCCRVRFPLFSWPSTCLLCKRSVCNSCSAKQMKVPYKKMAHIPVYTVGFHSSLKSHRSEVYKPLFSLSKHSVEQEFPHLYAAGCSLRDVCCDCTRFLADVISSSRRSLDFINNTPTRSKRTPSTQTHTSEG
ncbi:hypothetical protein DNTS_011931 [Danionella cerebrum]|uniref:KIND domain-containing protein n=1 Tax=Danionella cerebrum TaxID=2873325 RepID=A0A553Q7L0_9TELE|nr:hypothetical protein DNTS_011931 [Danionella translucida]